MGGVASSTPPQISLGKKNQRNNEDLPLWDKTPGTKEYLHLLASAATLTPTQHPLVDETPRNNPLASAKTLAVPASLGGRNPGEKFMEEDHAQRRTKMKTTDHGHSKTMDETKQNRQNETKRQKRRQTSKGEANKAGFFSGM